MNDEAAKAKQDRRQIKLGFLIWVLAILAGIPLMACGDGLSRGEGDSIWLGDIIFKAGVILIIAGKVFLIWSVILLLRYYDNKRA